MTVVIPFAVMAEVPIGLVVDQDRFTLQLLAPEAMVQVEVAGVRVPVIWIWVKLAITVQAPVIAPVV